MKYTSAEKIIIAIAAVIILSLFAFLGFAGKGSSDTGSNLESVTFDCEYQDKNGKWIKWDDDTQVNAEKQPEIKLRGHFNRAFAENEQLFFYVQNLEVHIVVDGREIYSFAEPGTYPDFMQSGGSLWDSIKISEQIDKDDPVEIHLISKYKYNYLYPYNEFLDSLAVGDSKALVGELIREYINFFIGGILLFIIGIFILFTAILMRTIDTRRFTSNTILGLHLMIGGMGAFVSGLYISLIFPYPYVLLNFEILFYVIVFAFLLAYLVYYVKEKHRIILRVEIMICVFIVTVMAIMQFSGVIDGFGIRNFIVLPVLAMEVLALGVVVNSLIKSKFKQNKWILISVIIYSIFLVAEVINYYFDSWRFPASMLIGLFIFLMIQGWLSIKETIQMVKNSQKVAAYEKEITESRIAVMLSQIQPHFLYNALNTIHYLCKTDPELAADTVEKFSRYLRVNLESLNDVNLIPFSDEIRHVENYVSIEKLRFVDIDIKFDFETVDFSVPALSIQPIVENAIKHGLAMKDGGGTVVIKTEANKENYVVTIKDDGVGYDITNPDDTETHIGISNTKKRVEDMTGGSLEVKSVIGKGTEVVIKIPVVAHGKDNEIVSTRT